MNRILVYVHKKDDRKKIKDLLQQILKPFRESEINLLLQAVEKSRANGVYNVLPLIENHCKAEKTHQAQSLLFGGRKSPSEATLASEEGWGERKDYTHDQQGVPES